MTLTFALVNSLIVQFALWSFGLYSREVVYSGQKLLSNLIGAFIFSAVLLFPACYSFSFVGIELFGHTTRFYILALFGFISVITLERFLVLKLYEDLPYLGNILVVGSTPATQKLIQDFDNNNGNSFRMAAVLSESSEGDDKQLEGRPIIGVMDDLRSILSTKVFDTILLSSSIYSPKLPIDDLLRAKISGVQVLDSADFYEKVNRKILLEKLDPVQLLLSENLLMTGFRWFLKDSMEKLMAIFLIAITFPLMLLAALAIKLTSNGSVFFRQTRTGKDGIPFEVLKFRTMVQDAEKDGKAQWAQKNDPRITWVGKILRKSRIDELPQIFNVLSGTMAFIGPRPERPEFVDMLKKEIPFYVQRHLIKPGITGWAQVSYRYGASVEDSREKLRYDLYYIKNMSLFFDLMIFLATIRTVLFKGYGQ